MTQTNTPIPDEAQSAAAPLELLTADDGVWTAVPANARGDEQGSEWLEVESDVLCDLETWR